MSDEKLDALTQKHTELQELSKKHNSYITEIVQNISKLKDEKKKVEVALAEIRGALTLLPGVIDLIKKDIATVKQEGAEAAEAVESSSESSTQ